MSFARLGRIAFLSILSAAMTLVGCQKASSKKGSSPVPPPATVTSASRAGSMPAGSLVVPRSLHTATLLPQGEVFVCGGITAGGAPAMEAELRQGGFFRLTAQRPATPRVNHTATLLPDGRVFIAGGQVGVNGLQYLSSTEIYDPLADRFLSGPGLRSPRTGHTATPYRERGQWKLLIAGGVTASGGGSFMLDSAESYDPATGSISVLPGRMMQPRANHVAAAMPAGDVLLHGGLALPAASNGQGPALAPAGFERFDPASGAFLALAPPLVGRIAHALVALPGGDALAVGGKDETGRTHAGAELFSAAQMRATATAGQMAGPREGFAWALTAQGTVMVVGGGDGSPQPLASTELYNPATGYFHRGPDLIVPRRGATATLLPTGEVLVCGGEIDAQGTPTAAAELLVPGAPTGPAGPRNALAGAAQPYGSGMAAPGQPSTTAGGILGGLVGQLSSGLLSRLISGGQQSGWQATVGNTLGNALGGLLGNWAGNGINGIVNGLGQPRPVLSQITPPQGAAGQTVVLVGLNFDPLASGNLVKFDKLGATALGIAPGGQTQQGTSYQLQVAVPFGLAPGSYQVTVTARGATSNPLPFTVR